MTVGFEGLRLARALVEARERVSRTVGFLLERAGRMGGGWAWRQPCPAGFPARSGSSGVGFAEGAVWMLGGGGPAGGSQEKQDLETALRFILVLKRQCGLYLYSTTKAIEFPSMGPPTMVCDEETDIFKYTESTESLFYATFNTFSELLTRDAVHRRVGMRMSSEEYLDLGMYDRVHKIIRFIVLVFQVLCSTQSAFKNIPIPPRVEAHVQG